MELTQAYRLSFATFMVWLMLLIPPTSYATHELPPGTTGDDFVQVGPLMDRLLLKVFSDETSEFLQLAAGEIDFTEWPMIAAFLDPTKPCAQNGLRNCPNIGLSSPQAEFGVFVFEFNLNNVFWGIDMENGLNPSGTEIRRAVNHLLDKDVFLANHPVVGGFASRTELPLSRAQNPNLPDFHLFDALHPTTISAFNIASDRAPGFAELDTDLATSGNQPSPDWVGALDHFAQVRDPATGLPGYWRDTNGDFVIDTNLPTSVIDAYCRVDHQPRFDYCKGIVAGLNQMFGKTVVARFDRTISQVVNTVFTSTKIDDWHLYSGGYGLSTEVATDFYFQHSVFGSNICVGSAGVGGPEAKFPGQYQFQCDDGNDAGELALGDPNLKQVGPGFFTNLLESDFDTFAYRMKFAATASESKAFERDAILRYATNVYSMGVYSAEAPLAYLRDPRVAGQKANAASAPDGNLWTGAINAVGYATQYPGNRWTFLNAFTSQPAPDAPGTVRMGFRQGTLNLDPFKSTTVWEGTVLSAVYGALLELNPYDPSQLISNHANSWVEGITPSELGYNRDTVLGVPQGTVQFTIRFNLRTDVFFHDGNQFSGEDVEFTLEEYKEELGAFVEMVGATCGAKNSCIDSGADDATDTNLDFTVDVHYSGISFVFIKELAAENGSFLIPKHYWDIDHDNEVDSTKLALSFDGMKEHALIGSGMYVCKDLVTGQLGGGCSSSGSSDTAPGDSFVLERYKANPIGTPKQYIKSVANFNEWNYADGKEEARTGNALADDQQVDIGDMGALLLCEGQSTGSCAYWVVDGGVVDSTERAIVARWLGVSVFDQTTGKATRWTSPLLWNQYLNTQPYEPTLPSIPP